MKKICIVTGARAEYNLLYWLMKDLEEDPEFSLMLVVTGMHLSPEFGSTVREIEEDGFFINDRVEMLLSSDSPQGMAKSIGLGTIGFADSFSRLRPDLVILLGDRFEMLAVAIAAISLNIPIAHISGGDLTEGAIDNQIRHAITKMSHLHFPARQSYADRIVQMGEEPWRVVVAGEPNLENIRRIEYLSKDELEYELGFSIGDEVALVSYHSVTLEYDKTGMQIDNLLEAISRLDMNVVFSYPNADAGGRIIISAINKYVNENPKAHAVKNLGGKRYLSLLRLSKVLIGNSSSGIVEAPYLNIPFVNVGNRQKGRDFQENVICCGNDTASIYESIREALDESFWTGRVMDREFHGKGNFSQKIKEVLMEIELGEKLLVKKFYKIDSI